MASWVAETKMAGEMKHDVVAVIERSKPVE
jgi:hypothetical protein